MSLDLSSYSAVQTNVFVELDIHEYQVVTFSDYHKSLELNSVTYDGLGQLLAVTNVGSGLRASPQDLTITISGIPSSNVTDFITKKIRGSRVEVLRAFFDPTTAQLLSVAGNPAGMFRGVVSNFEVADELEQGADTGSVSITFTCTNIVELLNNKVTGRRTNPIDQQEYYPLDKSMDRVPRLAKSNFNFGAPRK